jgi:Putative Ig domain/F5/8 type C domain
MPVDFAPHNLISATTPSPYVVTSSLFNASFFGSLPAYNAFDGTSNYCALYNVGVLGVTEQYIQLDLGSGNGQVLQAYAIKMTNTSEPTKAPRSWVMLGSSDGITFTTLDTRSNQGNWSNNEQRTFVCNTPSLSTFQYYRIRFTENNGDPTYVEFSELYLYSSGGIESLNFADVLPDGQTNTLYNHQLIVTGGVVPYSFSITGGSLPTGITMSSTGLIHGSTTTGGFFSFNIQVTDSASTVINATIPFFVFKPGPALSDAVVVLLESVFVTEYIQTPSAAIINLTLFIGNTANDPTLHYLGAGSPTSGVGVIFTAGASSFPKSIFRNTFNLNALEPTGGIKTSPALDVSGCILFLTINSGGGLGVTALNTWNVYEFYFRAVYSDGSVLYSFPSTTSLVRAGEEGDIFGAVSNPDLAVDKSIDTFASFTRSYFSTLSSSNTFEILSFGPFSNAPVLSCNNPPNGTIGKSYTHQIGISGGNSPYTIIGTSFPMGLSISNTGLISGVPSSVGNYDMNIQVTDSSGISQSISCPISISCPPVSGNVYY